MAFAEATSHSMWEVTVVPRQPRPALAPTLPGADGPMGVEPRAVGEDEHIRPRIKKRLAIWQ